MLLTRLQHFQLRMEKLYLKKVILCVYRNKNLIINFCFHCGYGCCPGQKCCEKSYQCFLKTSWLSVWLKTKNQKKLWHACCFIQSYFGIASNGNLYCTSELTSLVLLKAWEQHVSISIAKAIYWRSGDFWIMKWILSSGLMLINWPRLIYFKRNYIIKTPLKLEI